MRLKIRYGLREFHRFLNGSKNPVYIEGTRVASYNVSGAYRRILLRPVCWIKDSPPTLNLYLDWSLLQNLSL
jgi:hypothetical protein